MRNLAQRCNDYLIASGDDGRAAIELLAEAGRSDERLHTFIKSPLLDRPGFIEAPEVGPLEQDLSIVLDLLTSLPDRLFAGQAAAMCDRVGIQGPCRVAVLQTYDESSVLLARADVVRGRQGPKAIEFNIHSSLGGIDVGPLNETFLKLPVYRDFLGAEKLVFNDPLDVVVAALQQAAVTRCGNAEPTVALVDWPSSYPKFREVLERICAMLRARGVVALHTHVGTLEERNGYLWHEKIRIDILYRIFMLEDVPEQPALITPILNVHRAGNVLLAMSFFAELVGNKASLALLSEPTEPDFLTPREREAVTRILPETRLLHHGRTTWHGEPCDMFALARARQRQLVLKPAVGHGTHGVVPGWAVSESQWAHALGEAAGGTFVLQERVEAVPESVPYLRQGRFGRRDYDVNWGVFIHRGRFAGAMLRALPSSRPGVISLSAGAAVGCCFHQDPGDSL